MGLKKDNKGWRLCEKAWVLNLAEREQKGCQTFIDWFEAYMGGVGVGGLG